MKKDDRFWWEKDGLENYPLNDVYFGNERFLEPILNKNGDVESMVEQLWAIRENLA